ncbi:hypothetical protein M378DRAFT_14508 [Amanita muscaria Koide BX008]|uniref:Major facilitator superfamily (MFS) profile domain-containing protein n=1 Tax=Amanita muscaria (strain Koide BX008) TaxID=946122 RepID=A0A0C2T0A4_AMAMK|nr:hypothetical protein M378DRAFT_14508 [Amanita muscaria Koide BX008]
MAYPTVDEQTPLLTENGVKAAIKRTPLPKLQFAILLLVQLSEPIASASIFPYINQALSDTTPKLIVELGITGGDKRKVGYYAGIIVESELPNDYFKISDMAPPQESLFFATQAVTIFRWGRISDRVGRKPVLLIGLAGTALSMICFGLSRTFWTLVISRCICGFLNGNVGVMKSTLGELTDPTNRAEGMAFIPVVWSIGTTIAIAFIEMSFLAFYPLFMSTPVEFGGLGLNPSTIGYILGALGAYIGTFQILFFPRFVRRFGERRVFINGVLVFMVYPFLFTLISIIVRGSGVTWVVWALLAFTFSLRGFTEMSFSCAFIYITAASSGSGSLGATNGISQTTVSIARAIGPGLSTSLFALSLETNILGGYAVYAVFAIFSFLALLLAVQLPRKMWDEE